MTTTFPDAENIRLPLFIQPIVINKLVQRPILAKKSVGNLFGLGTMKP